MRNKLFATAKGVISLSWCIAVLFSLFVIIAANGRSLASTTPQISAGLQSPPLSKWDSGGCPEHFDSISKIEPAIGKSVGRIERSVTQQSNPKSETTNPKLDKVEFAQKTKKLQIPFIANNGQVDERVKFYANTFGGTVFVTKDGEIVYALPNNSSELGVERLKSEGRCKKSEARIQDNSESCIVDCASVENRTSDIVHSASCIVDQDSKSEFQNPKLSSSDSKNLKSSNPKSAIQNLPSTSIGDPKSGIALREEFVGARVKTIEGEDPSITKVNYFKGNDPDKWKNNISTYDFVNLGEIYKGIELKLKAYGDNVEKLFCVKPGASPDQIQVQLNGGKSLKINDEGQLVAETELGPVKFTKPVAYQEIDGKRVEVDSEYSLSNPKSEVQNRKSKIVNHKCTYGFTVASYDRTKDLIIDPLLASTFLGGSGNENSDYSYYSITLDKSGNVYVTGLTYSTDFPTTSGAYATSYNGNSDVFVSKLDGGLTSLLASTYLGGSGNDGDFSYGNSITTDISGNVYVTGSTGSTDFPVTRGAYDTSFNGGYHGDAFVSKLNSGLTSLLASTYLGGSGEDNGYSLTLDTSGNVYVTGETYSTDFPTTSGVYDTSFNGYRDAFVLKLDGGLTSLLASTYLGGSSYDGGTSLALDTNGNVYVAGGTQSRNFPTTSGAYDTSYNGDNADDFISKLNGELTSLLASTYLGGSNDDVVHSLTLDTSGNVYVTGYTYSTGFPTTSGAYNTTFNGGLSDGFVSKLNSGLTNLLASTYLGGYGYDYGNSLTLDTSGNVYVTGTAGSGFPMTSGAYDTSWNGSSDVFVSKLDGGLTSLLASTYLGGSVGEVGHSLVLDTSGNVYVTGSTWSTAFPTTSGAYDTSWNGGDTDVFVSKLDGNLSASLKPTVTTGTTTNVTSNSATLNGTANANGLSTSAWFNYGITSGSYSGTSTTQSVSGSSDTTVSIGISGLSSSTTYYYRIAASSSAGTSYGSEASFTTSSDPTPTPTPTPTDTTAPSGSVSINSGDSYTNSTSVTLTLSATDSVGVVGYYASTSSSTPTATASGWNSVTSATSYSGSVSYTLASGDESKTVYVWYKDAAGNVSITASDSITLDTTTPIVTINSPTSSDTYTTTISPLSLIGSASDSSSGVKEVTWSNDKGGSGTASGTTSWSVSSINLSNGDNVITVTATDGSGNSGIDTLTVTYNVTTTPTPTATTTPKPTPTAQPTPTRPPTLPPLPTPQVSPSPLREGIVFGFVNDQDELPLKGVTITITGKDSSDSTETDENGYYEFSGLVKGDFTLTYEKEGFLAQTQDISLEEGEVEDLGTVTMEQAVSGKIYGYVVNIKGSPIEFVRLRLKGIKTKVIKTASSDADGFFEFTDLEADTYVIIAKKKKYRNTQQKVKLEEGASEEIEIVMKKTSKRIKELLLEEDVQ